jgi:hypothetical protein
VSAERKRLVRVRDHVPSELAGRTLVVLKARPRSQGGRWPRQTPRPVDYLCEMPGHPHPGWFLHEEVDPA